MKTLAFDQSSTLTGYAFGDGGVCSACGLIDTRHRFADIGARMLKFEKAVKDLIALHKPKLIAFEAHRAHSGVQAAQMLAGVSAIIMKCAIEASIPYMGAEPSAHKKVFTGTGRASKEHTVAVARKKYPRLVVANADVADAISILHWSFEQV